MHAQGEHQRADTCQYNTLVTTRLITITLAFTRSLRAQANQPPSASFDVPHTLANEWICMRAVASHKSFARLSRASSSRDGCKSASAFRTLPLRVLVMWFWSTSLAVARSLAPHGRATVKPLARAEGEDAVFIALTHLPANANSEKRT